MDICKTAKVTAEAMFLLTSLSVLFLYINARDKIKDKISKHTAKLYTGGEYQR